MFLGGRSILHRIQHDLDKRGLGKCEDFLYRKLREGSEIRILILDPRSDLVDRLAREEHREPTALLKNLWDSIQIIKKLYKLTIDQNLPVSAHLCIKLYDKVPYFAYHKVDEKTFVGFYFATQLVSSSSVYAVEDEYTRNHLEQHFASIFLQAQTLLEISSQHAAIFFNEKLVEEIDSYITGRF
jgi:hypothetical protein